MSFFWTEPEVAILRTDYLERGSKWCARRISKLSGIPRTPAACKDKASALGIIQGTSFGGGIPWTAPEVAVLREYYPLEGEVPISERLERQFGIYRSPGACKSKAISLGIRGPSGQVSRESETTTTRKCLRCQEPFASAGIHNRLCQSCRKRAARGVRMAGWALGGAA